MSDVAISVRERSLKGALRDPWGSLGSQYRFPWTPLGGLGVPWKFLGDALWSLGGPFGGSLGGPPSASSCIRFVIFLLLWGHRGQRVYSKGRQRTTYGTAMGRLRAASELSIWSLAEGLVE